MCVGGGEIEETSHGSRLPWIQGFFVVVYTGTPVMGWGQSPLHQDNIAVQTFILLHIFLEPKLLIPVPTSCTDKGISRVCCKCCTVVNSLHLLFIGAQSVLTGDKTVDIATGHSQVMNIITSTPFGPSFSLLPPRSLPPLCRSYGILLYEFVTAGSVPYASFSNSEVKAKVKDYHVLKYQHSHHNPFWLVLYTSHLIKPNVYTKVEPLLKDSLN